MESEYHGFFVGPAASVEAMDAAIEAAALGSELVVGLGVPRVWALVQTRRHAKTLARALGDGAWLWEVELRNEFGGQDGDGDGDGDSHSGTITGSQWSVSEAELLPRIRDALWEDGLIRGGVMAEVAFEYVRWYARTEVEAASNRVGQSGPGPSTPTGPTGPTSGRRPEAARTLEDLDVDALTKVATELIEHLLETGDLEIVNHHARTSLVAPLEACMSASASPVEAAARLALTLEDAPEVVEIYVTEDELEAFIVRALEG